jgi:hypothetical protein
MATAPTTAELMAIITQLQAQIVALQNAAPAAATGPLAGAATVVFVDMPQMLGADDLIDYSMKQGSAIFKQGCKALNDKALTNGFAMTPDQTIIFIEAFHHCAMTMGWNQGARQITLFANSLRRQVNIIKATAKLTRPLSSLPVRGFCKPGGVDSQTRVKQNNTMMSICLEKLLTADAQARLLIYRNKYTFDGVEYAPLMYKIIIRLATINSVATTQTLSNNPQLLGVYAATVSSDIDKVHNKLKQNYSQLIARGATIDDPIGILFEAYLLVPCPNFKMYICHQHEDYLHGKLTTIPHKALTTSAKHKFNWLKTKELLGPKIMAMTAPLIALKGQLKLDPKFSAIANEGKKKGNKKDNKKKNKKKTSNQWEQKRMKPGRKSHQRTVKSMRNKWQIHLPLV